MSLQSSPVFNPAPASKSAISTVSDLVAHFRALIRRQHLSADEKPIFDFHDPALRGLHILKFPQDDRMIVRAASEPSAKTSPLALAASGIIIDTASWTVLTAPPANLTGVYSGAGRLELEAEFSQYTCWKIRDGVFASLYWYNGVWNIGTRNSTNLAGKTWVGQKNYLAILNECLEAVGVRLWDLSREYSYSIGFAHPEQHPAETVPSVWLVQAYHVESRVIIQSEAELARLGTGIPIYTCVPSEEMPGVSSAEEFLEWDRQQQSNDPAYCGFILRPKKSAARSEFSGELRHWIGKSDRLKWLEKYFYNVIKPASADRKIRYAALISARLPEQEAKFLEIFPRLDYVMLTAWAAINNFTTLAHAVLSTGVATPNRQANALADELRQNNILSASSANSHSILEDIILSRIDQPAIVEGIFQCWN